MNAQGGRPPGMQLQPASNGHDVQYPPTSHNWGNEHLSQMNSDGSHAMRHPPLPHMNSGGSHGLEHPNLPHLNADGSHGLDHSNIPHLQPSGSHDIEHVNLPQMNNPGGSHGIEQSNHSHMMQMQPQNKQDGYDIYPPSGRRAMLDQRVPQLSHISHMQHMEPAVKPNVKPEIWAHSDGTRTYTLTVEQQPVRARMCGFGDKDRRPITPPPCVRLLITDSATGKECDVNEIDYSKFILTVELWSADGLRESNLVRHSSSSPCIQNHSESSFQDASAIPKYSPLSHLPSGPTVPGDTQFKYENTAPFHQSPPSYNPFPVQPQVNPFSQSQGQQGFGGPQYQSGYNVSGHQPSGFQPQYGNPQNQYFTGPNIHAMGHATMHSLGHSNIPAMGNQNMPLLPHSPTLQPGVDFGPAGQPLAQNQHSSVTGYGGRPYTEADLSINRMPPSGTTPTGMFTRNLIGSLSASASRLSDCNSRIGIWFVLQDLSVRTEGTFRLRFSFVNIGIPVAPAKPGRSSPPETTINTGRSPVLACTFSEPFQVFSAKKFPGVVDSTNLSKCFATQGIKIPIRKDGKDKGSADGQGEQAESPGA